MKFLLAIAILIPFAAAGEPAFDQTSIRLFEQADGPILPVPRRLYSTRFDTTQLHAHTTGRQPFAVGASDVIPVLRREDGIA